MDELIQEMLEEYQPQQKYLFDEPIPQDVERELPQPLEPQQPFIDLDTQAPPTVRLSGDEQWVGIRSNAKDEFDVDGASAVFSTWRVEEEDTLDIGC